MNRIYTSATADARIRTVSPDVEGEYNEIANNVIGTKRDYMYVYS
jgi:hypothetical protein